MLQLFVLKRKCVMTDQSTGKVRGLATVRLCYAEGGGFCYAKL